MNVCMRSLGTRRAYVEPQRQFTLAFVARRKRFFSGTKSEPKRASYIMQTLITAFTTKAYYAACVPPRRRWVVLMLCACYQTEFLRPHTRRPDRYSNCPR